MGRVGTGEVNAHIRCMEDIAIRPEGTEEVVDRQTLSPEGRFVRPADRSSQNQAAASRRAVAVSAPAGRGRIGSSSAPDSSRCAWRSAEGTSPDAESKICRSAGRRQHRRSVSVAGSLAGVGAAARLGAGLVRLRRGG
jgi:hypothetical protein